MQSKIATILVNYNGLSDTIECIKSIQKSKYACHIVIVDNASEGPDVKILCAEYPNLPALNRGPQTTSPWFATWSELMDKKE